MSIKLQSLYEAINNQFDVILHTKSFFDKEVNWIHTVEQSEFSRLLHGDELIFNSGLNFTSQEWLKDFLKSLKDAHASGLIISVRSRPAFSQEIIDYCNEIEMPLFSTSWDTPFIDIMRIFSEILLKNEQRETSLAAALKNAIYYPENEDSYLNSLERSGFFRDMNYTVIMVSCHTYDSASGNSYLEQIEKKIRYFMTKGIIYEEGNHLIVLLAGDSVEQMIQKLYQICQDNSDVYAGIGTTVSRLTDIHRSYESAFTAYQLTKTAIPKNFLEYNKLGVYKLLADIHNQSLTQEFLTSTLGPLLNYDETHHTDYLHILEVYFEHDCSIIHTASALYCHKNTLTYKLNKIKEILDLDILTNENRTDIMLSFYILRLQKRSL